jgi:hypothetical protein
VLIAQLAYHDRNHDRPRCGGCHRNHDRDQHHHARVVDENNAFYEYTANKVFYVARALTVSPMPLACACSSSLSLARLVYNNILAMVGTLQVGRPSSHRRIVVEDDRHARG